jgi:hypothetical protein
MIILTQSAILLGFWYSDTEYRTGSWNWTGRAISLAQTIGLHRDLDARQTNTVLSDRQRRLWRRVWWSCVFRDRWLSLGMGRPMRICADDCDVPKPTVADVTDDLKDLSLVEWAAYVPLNLAELSKYWICFINLTIVLGDILAKNYRPRSLKLVASEVIELEKKIVDCDQTGATVGQQSLYSEFFGEFLRLQQE